MQHGSVTCFFGLQLSTRTDSHSNKVDNKSIFDQIAKNFTKIVGR